MAKAKVEAAPAGLVIPPGVKFFLSALGRLALAKLTEWLDKQGVQLQEAARQEVRAEMAAQAPQAETPPAA